MQKRPEYKLVKEYTKDYALSELRALDWRKVRKDLGMVKDRPTEKDKYNLQVFDLYFPGIKQRLIQNVLEQQKADAMNVMTNKLLLSGAALTRDEAEKAVEKVYEERDKTVRSIG